MTAVTTGADLTCPSCGRALLAGARFCRGCGHRLDDPTVQGRPGRIPAAVRAIARVPRRWLVTAVVAVVVLAVGASLWTTQNVTYPPDKPVRELFDALAARDSGRVAALLSTEGNPMLADGVLNTGYEPPTDVQIGEVTHGSATDSTQRPNTSVAYVAVSYLVGGQQVEMSVEVLREHDGAVREWFLGDDALIPFVVLSQHSDRARVGGATIPTDREVPLSGADARRALPGVYTVTAVEDDPLLSSEPVRLILPDRGDSIPSVRLDAAINADAKRQVESLVRERLDKCAARHTSDVYDKCPFRLDRPGHVMTDISWRMERYPVIDIGLSKDPAAAGGRLVFDTSTTGKAMITYTEGGRHSAVVEFAIYGVADVGNDGKLELTRFGRDD